MQAGGKRQVSRGGPRGAAIWEGMEPKGYLQTAGEALPSPSPNPNGAPQPHWTPTVLL